MAQDHTQALQDTFLRHVREHKVPVTVFLTNGVRLQGTVTAFWISFSWARSSSNVRPCS